MANWVTLVNQRRCRAHQAIHGHQLAGPQPRVLQPANSHGNIETVLHLIYAGVVQVQIDFDVRVGVCKCGEIVHEGTRGQHGWSCDFDSPGFALVAGDGDHVGVDVALDLAYQYTRLGDAKTAIDGNGDVLSFDDPATSELTLGVRCGF